jgi:hypothetical protein
MSQVNETLIRDVVAEVLSRLNGAPIALPTSSAPAQHDCGCNGKGRLPGAALRGKFGVFQDANEACLAAQEAFEQLRQKGVAARRKVEEIVKSLAEKNAETWGPLELDETKTRPARSQDRETPDYQTGAWGGLASTGRPKR